MIYHKMPMSEVYGQGSPITPEAGKKRACLVRATVEHELIVSYLELKNAIFLVLTLIKHSLGMSEQLSL